MARSATTTSDADRPGFLWPSLGVGAALGAVVLGGVFPNLPVDPSTVAEPGDVYLAVMIPAHAVGLLVARRLRSRGLDLGEPLFNALLALLGTVAAVRGLGWAFGVHEATVQPVAWATAVLVWAAVLVRTADGLSVRN